MTKVKLIDGATYMSNETGDVWTLNEDYNGLWYLDRRDINGGYSKMLSISASGIIPLLKLHYSIIEGLSLEEKAKSYDELYLWYLWLKRRKKNGKVDKQHVETFLQAIKKEFEGEDAE